MMINNNYEEMFFGSLEDSMIHDEEVRQETEHAMNGMFGALDNLMKVIEENKREA